MYESELYLHWIVTIIKWIYLQYIKYLINISIRDIYLSVGLYKAYETSNFFKYSNKALSSHNWKFTHYCIYVHIFEYKFWKGI